MCFEYVPFIQVSLLPETGVEKNPECVYLIHSRAEIHLRNSPPINLPQSGSSAPILRLPREGGGVDARGISEYNATFSSLLKVTLCE